jgi:hypothetical protein
MTPLILFINQFFARAPFRLGDFAELVYLQQGSGRVKRQDWWGSAAPVPVRHITPFTQLGGTIAVNEDGLLWNEPKQTNGGQVALAAPGWKC